MTDRDVAIEALEEAIPFMRVKGYFGVALIMHDALELLKAQEPVKPIKPRGSASWICGACKIAIGTSLIYHFCPWCGKAVKQDE